MKGEKSKSSTLCSEDDSESRSEADIDDDDAEEKSGSESSSDEEQDELQDTDTEVTFNTDVSPILRELEHSNVGGACGSASDLPDPEEAGTSGEMETDGGEPDDEDVSDVQDSQPGPSQPRRSDTGLWILSRMRSESGQDGDALLYNPTIRRGRRSHVWDHGGCKMINGVMDKEHVYCAHSDKEFKYTGTVGNLQTHLKNIHHITAESNKPQDSTASTPQTRQHGIDSIFKPSA